MRIALILGAGASAHLKYPTGSELIKKILSLENSFDYSGNGEFFRMLRLAQPPSIDDFLNTHSSNTKFSDLGKSLIAEVIFRSENAKLLEESVEHDWYTLFLNQAIASNGIEDPLKNVSIISFNYDRSLEITIANRLAARTASTLKTSLLQLRLNQVVHIYGRLPLTPDEYFASSGKDTMIYMDPYPEYGAFSANTSQQQQPRMIDALQESKKSIKTFYESTDSVDAAKEIIQNSDRVVFLGFGFHNQNMRALGFDFKNPKACESKIMVATRLGMSNVNFQALRASYGSRISTANANCYTLLADYISLFADSPVVAGFD